MLTGMCLLRQPLRHCLELWAYVTILTIMKKLQLLTMCLVLSVASFAGGYIIKGTKQPTSVSNMDQVRQFPLLAKRLFLEDPNDTIINFSALREELKGYMSKNSLKGSLYFEYLPTGTSVRIDGDDEQVAASLMKIPVVMELYKAAELGRIDLDSTIALKQEWLDPAYGELYKQGVGYRLTLREAAKLALTKSDNTAISAILYTTQNILKVEENVISSLDVAFERDEKLLLSISARSYASFLKCLYFSCYVNNADSQQILGYLTESTFNNRLRSNIPESVKIAHKIGTYSNLTQSDCGIVYEDKRNYLLCIMLRVPDNPTGNAHIAALSKLAYDYIKISEPSVRVK